MAMSPEERRTYEREKKRRQRARKAAETKLTAVPPLPPDEGTDDEVSTRVPASNVTAVRKTFEAWRIPDEFLYLATQAVTLARGLDDLSRVPQHAALSSRLTETMATLRKASMPKAQNWLGALRDEFSRGDADKEAAGS